MHIGLMLLIPGYVVILLWIIVDGSLIRSECKRIQILARRKLGAFVPGVWKFGYTCSIFIESEVSYVCTYVKG